MINPLWSTEGSLISQLGVGPWRTANEAFVQTFHRCAVWVWKGGDMGVQVWCTGKGQRQETGWERGGKLGLRLQSDTGLVDPVAVAQ